MRGAAPPPPDEAAPEQRCCGHTNRRGGDSHQRKRRFRAGAVMTRVKKEDGHSVSIWRLAPRARAATSTTRATSRARTMASSDTRFSRKKSELLKRPTKAAGVYQRAT